MLGHVTGLLFCLYVKLFLPSIYNSVDFWSSMYLILLDIELTEKNIVKELVIFIDGSLQGFSFCSPKSFTPNKKTTSNTSHLHGITWSSGKLDYDKLFAVLHHMKVSNSEVFAKGLEKCRLLSRLMGQNVEIWMTTIAQKFKILSKRTVCESALVTLSDTKQGFTVPRRKQTCLENGLCSICKLCTCLLYLCLLLI